MATHWISLNQAPDTSAGMMEATYELDRKWWWSSPTSLPVAMEMAAILGGVGGGGGWLLGFHVIWEAIALIYAVRGLSSYQGIIQGPK